MSDLRVGMIYPTRGHRGTQLKGSEYGHPAHRGFARAIGARDVVLAVDGIPDLGGDRIAEYLLSGFLSPIPESDVFVTENDSVLYATPRLSYQYPSTPIVHLAASDRLLGEVDVPYAAETPEDALHRRTMKRADRTLIRRFLTQYCDGVIAVSEYVASELRSSIGDALPIRVVNPYVQPDVYEELEPIEPDLSGTVAVTVGQWRDHKGVDMLVDAWPTVRERHPGAELRIVGPGHPPHYADTVGVTVRGRVPSLAAEFADASLYVHPAHLEPFGVSVVEAMLAGLPPVVTSTTGAESVVRSIEPSLVVEPSPPALADAISGYFDEAQERRRDLSEASKTQGRAFTERRQTGQFRRQFHSILEAIR